MQLYFFIEYSGRPKVLDQIRYLSIALYYDVLRYISVSFLAGKYFLPQIRSRRTLAA